MSIQRIALVSGGNRGIGLAIGRGLADLGLTVVLGSRDLQAGERAARSLSAGRVSAVQLDVTQDSSVRDALATILTAHGALHVLVNNAGVYLDEGVSGLDVDMETVRVTLDTNLVGALRLCQAVAPVMRKQGYGRIVNLSSGYGETESMDDGGVLAYKLSKLALNGMTRILAAELRGTGVLVNAMDPGWVRTRMGGRSARRSPEQGADTALYLANLPDDGPTGRLFRDRKVVRW
jgi:NAD(P)-dependent dehydrogenase (short-subunit alcohol dehydrogenase family)